MGKESSDPEAPLPSDTYAAPIEIKIDQDPGDQETSQQQQQQQQFPLTSTVSGPPDETPLRQCRICFETEQEGEEDPDNPLISPCLCSGSSRYIHRNCLQQWRNSSHREDAFYQCDVCKFQYQYRRLWYAGVLGSVHTSRILFVLFMTLLCFTLGYIPRWESDCNPEECNAFATGALHMLGGLMTVAILGFILGMLLLLVRCIILQCFCSSDDAELPPGWCLYFLGVTSLCLPTVSCILITNSPLLIVVQMFWYGLQVACLTLYASLWLGILALLSRAQQMVENIGNASEGALDKGDQKSAATMPVAAAAPAVAGDDDDDDSKDIEAGGENARLLG